MNSQDRDITTFKKFVYSLLHISGAFTYDGTPVVFLSNALEKQALEMDWKM